MDDKKEILLKYLEILGIKGYEGRAFLSLLRLGEATATQIAKKSGIPLPRIYDVLEGLNRKGLIMIKAGRPRKYRALSPSIALTRYVKNYVDRIMKLNSMVVEELEKLFRTKQSREPYIWISHSLDASIEHAQEWIRELVIDGYASLNIDLFTKMINTIHKKLSSNKGSLFSVTLFSEPEKSLLQRLESMPNIRVLYQPTGFIKAIESDFERCVIFGKDYSLFSTEPEIMILLNDAYYFGYWRIARVIKEFDIRRNAKYMSKHQWLVLPLISQALKDGYNVRLHAVGRTVNEGNPIDIHCHVVKVYRSPDDRTRTIICEEDTGERIHIGGMGASVEDVEALYLEVIIQ